MPNYLHQNPGYMSTNFIAGQVTSNFKGVTMRSVTIAKFLEVWNFIGPLSLVLELVRCGLLVCYYNSIVEIKLNSKLPIGISNI